MKVLTLPSEIRRAVRALLSDRHDDRVVVVAFFGADARSFISDPRGLALYCWAKAGGTNPYGVEDLCQAGVQVNFVDRLHAKLYWSRKRGAIVGSANLTNNALGDSGLREYVL